MLDYPHLRAALEQKALAKHIPIPPGYDDHGNYPPGVVCRALIREVQAAYGLTVTGLFDAPTRALLIPPAVCPKPPLQSLPGLVVIHGIRPLTAIKHVVLHTTEGGGTLQSLGTFFKDETPEKDGVCFAVDPAGGCCQYVPETAIVWHVASHNTECIGIEQIGFHDFTRAEWLGPRLDQIHATAWIVAWLCQEHGIPVRRSAADRKWIQPSGVCQHDDVPDNDHLDCGPGYPFDVVLSLASAWQHGGPPLAIQQHLRALQAAA